MIELKYNKDGLIPAIIQDYKTNEVLMLGYMNKDSITRMLKEGKTCFYSRSRRCFWLKGEQSGHFQYVKEVYFDCDMDTILVKVDQIGGACHKGYKSCFYRRCNDTMDSFEIVADKIFNPEEKYKK